MALYEPQTGDRTISPFQLVASSTHRGHLQAPQPVRQRQRPLLRGAGRCEPCSADAGDYERGDRLPTRVLDGAPGRQQLGRAGDKTRIIESPEVLTLSPERGAVPPDRCGGS